MDQATETRDAFRPDIVETVTDAIVEGIILVVLVLVVFLEALRPSAVVALSIPFSVLFATLGMDQLGISANLMSLGGLAIAIGMMADGTIVFVENVDRMLREAPPGEWRVVTVSRACREVARPITFAVLIIIVVFLSILPGIIAWLKERRVRNAS